MKINLLFARISAFLIDLSIVFSFSILINLCVPLHPAIGTFQILIFLLFLYSFIFHVTNSCTPGKYLLQVKLFTNSKEKPTFKTLIKREFLLKFLTGILLFLSIYFFFKNKNSHISSFIDINTSLFIVSILGFIVFLLVWLFIKNTWWDVFSGTLVEHTEIPKYKFKKAYIFLILFYGLSFSLIGIINNSHQNHNFSFLGFKYPLNFKKYISNSSVKSHSDFLREQHTSPKDYIFDLFSENDIIILCERSHRETTQWDFIYDLVSDERFINKVGHVFTEYGASSKQAKVDSMLTKKFEDDTLLEKEIAKLMEFMNVGFFNFLKDLNKLNNNLPDSLKIHEYFTDLDIYSEYIQTSGKSQRRNRDSLMASIVVSNLLQIQQHEKRKKCLVICNSRHAYGLVKKNGKELKDYSFNEARLIFKVFPKSTANVLINRLTFNPYTNEYPIHHGLWDRAFAEIGDKPTGFNFNDTPFGEDEFDLFPWSKETVNYEDVFTGFIYINPFDQWNFDSGYPFRQYGWEQEWLAKSANAPIDTTKFSSDSEHLKPNNFKDKTFWYIWHGLYNIIPFLIYFFLVCVGVIISTYHLLKYCLINK